MWSFITSPPSLTRPARSGGGAKPNLRGASSPAGAETDQRYQHRLQPLVERRDVHEARPAQLVEGDVAVQGESGVLEHQLDDRHLGATHGLDFDLGCASELDLIWPRRDIAMLYLCVKL